VRPSIRSLLTSLLLMVTAGCATTARYEEKLDGWVGLDVNQLIASWGPPTSSLSTPSSRTLLAWSTTRASTGPLPSKSLRNEELAVAAAHRRPTRTFWCTTTFAVDGSGKILTWQRQGNGCISH
jgi:hypothetical protein